MEDVVQKMREDIRTSAVGKDVNSFRVSYVSDAAEKARKVTERLASLYIEQNLKDRENQADSTSQFLNTQLEEAKRRLVEQEKKLEEYRKSHAGQLPSQLQGNLQASQTASLQLQSLNESMNRAQERRLLIERQIADSKAVPVPAGCDVRRMLRRWAPRNNSRFARARLALALQRYTPSHPEVASLERTIADLVTKLESETPRRCGAGAEKTLTPAEAEQQKRILDFQAELAVIDYQVGRESHRSRAAEQPDRRLSGEDRCRADPRIRTGRADARLQHDAGRVHEPSRQARGRHARRQPRDAGRSASNSSCSTRRRCRKGRTIRRSALAS